MNYMQKTISGDITQWRRASKVELINSDIPEARVFVQDRTVYPDGTVRDDAGPQLDFKLTDPLVEIPLIDPATYEPTEATFTAGQFQVMAASVALWLMRGPVLPPVESDEEVI